MENKPNVLISVPNGDSWIHKNVVFALLRMAQDPRVRAKIVLPTNRPFENNLAHCQKEVLAGGFDYWISLDDDNPPTKNPIDLVFLDKDIVGCPTPVWYNAKPGDYPIYWNAVDWDEEAKAFRSHKDTKGLQEVTATGSGCMVVARRVLEVLKAPFQRTWNEDGTMELGCDYAFCLRARAEGFKVYSHFDYPCKHHRELELTEVITAFQALEAANGIH